MPACSRNHHRCLHSVFVIYRMGSELDSLEEELA